MKRKILSNQQLRARKDLLQAASRLVQQGRKPTMDEVASEALMSRASVYRYFKNIESLLVEAPLDAAVQEPEAVFSKVSTKDPEKRIDIAEASLHKVCFENESALRIMLANSIAESSDSEATPHRQNRRTPLIKAALEPGRERIKDELYEPLCKALAVLFGSESMIVFKDVLRVDEPTAREVKSWATRALVRAALKNSSKG